MDSREKPEPERQVFNLYEPQPKAGPLCTTTYASVRYQLYLPLQYLADS